MHPDLSLGYEQSQKERQNFQEIYRAQYSAINVRILFWYWAAASDVVDDFGKEIWSCKIQSQLDEGKRKIGKKEVNHHHFLKAIVLGKGYWSFLQKCKVQA